MGAIILFVWDVVAIVVGLLVLTALGAMIKWIIEKFPY